MLSWNNKFKKIAGSWVCWKCIYSTVSEILPVNFALCCRREKSSLHIKLSVKLDTEKYALRACQVCLIIFKIFVSYWIDFTLCLPTKEFGKNIVYYKRYILTPLIIYALYLLVIFWLKFEHSFRKGYIICVHLSLGYKNVSSAHKTFYIFSSHAQYSSNVMNLEYQHCTIVMSCV